MGVFQIKFESHVTRGRNDRDWPVTVTADVRPGTCAADSEVECVCAVISDDTYDVTSAEFEFLDEQAWDVAQDYLADYFEEAACAAAFGVAA